MGKRKQKRGAERVVKQYLGALDVDYESVTGTDDPPIEALIESCICALHDIDPKRASKLEKEFSVLIADCDGERAKGEQLLEEFFVEHVRTAMCEYEPPFFWFGKNFKEREQAQYGYWFSSSDFEDACFGKDPDVLKVSDAGEAQRDACERLVSERAFPQYYAVVNDHGNVTLYEAPRIWIDKRGRVYMRQALREVWSIV